MAGYGYNAPSLYKAAGRGDLTADDYNYFQTQKRQVNTQYALGIAQNKFQRDSAKANYLRQKDAVGRSWKQRFADFQAPYAANGLLNSGLYAQGRDRFNTARNAEHGDLLAAYNERTGALKLADRQLWDVMIGGLNDASSAEAARRASVAEELTRARTGL